MKPLQLLSFLLLFAFCVPFAAAQQSASTPPREKEVVLLGTLEMKKYGEGYSLVFVLSQPVPGLAEVQIVGRATGSVQFRNLTGKEISLRGIIAAAHTKYHVTPWIFAPSLPDNF